MFEWQKKLLAANASQDNTVMETAPLWLIPTRLNYLSLIMYIGIMIQKEGALINLPIEHIIKIEEDQLRVTILVHPIAPLNQTRETEVGGIIISRIRAIIKIRGVPLTL